MKKISAFLLSLAVCGSIAAFSATSAVASPNLSNAFQDVDKIAGQGGAGYNTGQNTNGLLGQIGMIIQIILGLLGVIFLALSFYAGWKWMMSQGSAKEVDDAMNILKSAIIGLIIVLSAYAISTFVIQKLASKTLTI